MRLQPAVIAAALVVVLGASVVAADPLDNGIRIRKAHVPSFWNDVTLTCDVTSFSKNGSRLEVFNCRPDAGGHPPPGRYDERTTTWNSDLDHRQAARHEIVIARSGAVSGWASY